MTRTMSAKEQAKDYVEYFGATALDLAEQHTKRRHPVWGEQKPAEREYWSEVVNEIHALTVTVEITCEQMHAIRFAIQRATRADQG